MKISCCSSVSEWESTSIPKKNTSAIVLFVIGILVNIIGLGLSLGGIVSFDILGSLCSAGLLFCVLAYHNWTKTIQIVGNQKIADKIPQPTDIFSIQLRLIQGDGTMIEFPIEGRLNHTVKWLSDQCAEKVDQPGSVWRIFYEDLERLPTDQLNFFSAKDHSVIVLPNEDVYCVINSKNDSYLLIRRNDLKNETIRELFETSHLKFGKEDMTSLGYIVTMNKSFDSLNPILRVRASPNTRKKSVSFAPLPSDKNDKSSSLETPKAKHSMSSSDAEEGKEEKADVENLHNAPQEEKREIATADDSERSSSDEDEVVLKAIPAKAAASSNVNEFIAHEGDSSSDDDEQAVSEAISGSSSLSVDQKDEVNYENSSSDDDENVEGIKEASLEAELEVLKDTVKRREPYRIVGVNGIKLDRRIFLNSNFTCSDVVDYLDTRCNIECRICNKDGEVLDMDFKIKNLLDRNIYIEPIPSASS